LTLRTTSAIPLDVSRECKHLAHAGARGLQVVESNNMKESTNLLLREEYAKVQASVVAMRDK
jgi:hypothetical protein